MSQSLSHQLHPSPEARAALSTLVGLFPCSTDGNLQVEGRQCYMNGEPDVNMVDQSSQSDGAVAPARVKVLNPLTSTGPSMRAELLNSSDEGLQVRVPRSILVGSMVQVRTREGIAFGEVRSSAVSGEEFEIGVVVQRLT